MITELGGLFTLSAAKKHKQPPAPRGVLAVRFCFRRMACKLFRISLAIRISSVKSNGDVVEDLEDIPETTSSYVQMLEMHMPV
jgi:hypothetical protein